MQLGTGGQCHHEIRVKHHKLWTLADMQLERGGQCHHEVRERVKHHIYQGQLRTAEDISRDKKAIDKICCRNFCDRQIALRLSRAQYW